MTDLTILIAVTALALWPVVFLLSRIMHERRKRLEHPERIPIKDSDNTPTADIVISTLKKMGCQPETDEEGRISFKYQGDDFFIVVEDECRMIMIWNPWWASISLDNEALPYLKEVINAVNTNSLVTTVYAIDEDEKTIGVHSKCHTLLTLQKVSPDKQLTDILNGFFSVHDAIKDGLKQLGNETAQDPNQDRVKVRGFAAYKDNSTALKPETEEFIN